MKKALKITSLVMGILCIVLCALLMLSFSINLMGRDLGLSRATRDAFDKVLALTGGYNMMYGLPIPYINLMAPLFLFVFFLVSGIRFLKAQNKPETMGTCIASLVFGFILFIICISGAGLYKKDDGEYAGLVSLGVVMVLLPVLTYVFHIVAGVMFKKADAAAAQTGTEVKTEVAAAENTEENK